MNVTSNYVFFWGGILGNWWKVEEGITWGGKKFPTSEHLFMWLKANLFGDKMAEDLILEAPDPKTAKYLGRKVQGFSDSAWEEHREQCMMTALHAKYLSSRKFREEIWKEEYEGKHFVEASPYDKIWGIGMKETDPEIENPENWKGLNLLGKCLDNLKEKSRN